MSNKPPTFTPEQRTYIAGLLAECWKKCHDEHCHKNHDCKNDVQYIIDELFKLGLSEIEVVNSITKTLGKTVGDLTKALI